MAIIVTSMSVTKSVPVLIGILVMINSCNSSAHHNHHTEGKLKDFSSTKHKHAMCRLFYIDFHFHKYRTKFALYTKDI